MTLPKLALTLSIAALAGSALGQSSAPPATQQDGNAIGEPWAEYQVENAALLYYRYWMIGQDLISPEIMEQFASEAGWRPSDEFVAELEKGQETIHGFLKATNIRHADWGVEYDEGIQALLPHIGRFRYTARILTADGLRLLESGEVEEAAERVAALYRMGEQTSSDRILISSLVGIAITALANRQVEELIASEELTGEAREIILDAMDAIDLDNPANVRGAVLGERDVFLRWTASKCTGPDAGEKFVAEVFPMMGGTDSPPEPWRATIAKYGEAQLRADIRRAERYYDDVLSIWDLPDAGDRIDQLALLIENGHYGKAGSLLLPAMSKVWESSQKIRRELIETRKLLENARVVVKEEQSEDED